MKNFYIVIALFVSFILFTACGGTDCEGSDCDELTDEISVTDENEVTDDATDETVDEVADDVVDDSVDSEPSDNEEIPDEDQGVTADCSKLLDIVGGWISIDVEGYAITVMVEPREIDCRVLVKWTQGFNGTQEWYGLELPLSFWSEDSYRYLTLKKNGENLIREETESDGTFAKDTVFKKIQ